MSHSICLRISHCTSFVVHKTKGPCFVWFNEKPVNVESPWNFSWVARGELAASACPGSKANLRFLADQGVGHLVTLSRTHKPPLSILKEFPELSWTLIDVAEFEPPSLPQMQQFIQICIEAREQKQVFIRNFSIQIVLSKRFQVINCYFLLNNLYLI